jgi:hypothetical protein
VSGFALQFFCNLCKEFKQAIQEIPVEELQKLVIQLASKNKEITIL